MHLLVDITNHRPIAIHESYRALAALGYIQFANVDLVILKCGKNASYSQFDGPALRKLYEASGHQLPHMAYPDMISAVRKLLEETEWLKLPFEASELEAQAYALDPKDDRPYAFEPGKRDATRLPNWHFPPQVNRQRRDCTVAVHFASAAGPAQAGVHPAKAASAPTARPKPRPATSAAPKAPRAPSGPATRPKGGSTGKVWDIADELSKIYAGSELRKEVVKRCEAEGINSSTASVQFGKWKSAGAPSN